MGTPGSCLLPILKSQKRSSSARPRRRQLLPNAELFVSKASSFFLFTPFQILCVSSISLCLRGVCDTLNSLRRLGSGSRAHILRAIKSGGYLYLQQFAIVSSPLDGCHSVRSRQGSALAEAERRRLCWHLAFWWCQNVFNTLRLFEPWAPHWSQRNSSSLSSSSVKMERNWSKFKVFTQFFLDKRRVSNI